MGVAPSFFLIEERENPEPLTYSERAEQKMKVSKEKVKNESLKRSSPKNKKPRKIKNNF